MDKNTKYNNSTFGQFYKWLINYNLPDSVVKGQILNNLKEKNIIRKNKSEK